MCAPYTPPAPTDPRKCSKNAHPCGFISAHGPPACIGGIYSGQPENGTPAGDTSKIFCNYSVLQNKSKVARSMLLAFPNEANLPPGEVSLLKERRMP